MRITHLLTTFAIFGLFTSSFVFADTQTSIGIGDDELWISPRFSDNDAKFSPSISTTTDISSPTGGSPTPRKYYDVILHVLNKKHQPNDLIEATITLDFQPLNAPQQDGILQYQLITPSHKVLSPIIQTIREGDNQKTITYQLPSDAEIGQWTFITIWTVEDLDPMTAQDVFNVNKPLPFLPIISIFALLLIAISWLSFSKPAPSEANT